MNIIEETFIKTFIKRDRRQSWLKRLAVPKTRAKHVHRLAHTLDRDLDERYMYDKAQLPPQVAIQVQQVLIHWKNANPQQLCHVIAVRDERDGQMVALEEIEADYFLSFGAIIIVVPDKLIYYHTERSNLNQQPFYVLFRP